MRDLDRVLAILPDEAADLPDGAAELLAQREAAREARDWTASDRLRDDLAALGVAVEDTRDGQRWRRLERV
jgi:cysteinyl-tRNA synthetase